MTGSVATIQPVAYCECGCGGETNPAPYTDRNRGWVKGEPLRFIFNHHNRKPQIRHTVAANGCWIYPNVAKGEYGKTWAGDGITVRAHRFYYERFVGPIPGGAELDHLCGDTRCVNPDHLEPVDHMENIRRGQATKLTPADVRAIRESDEPRRVLAERYAVTPESIWQIRTHRTWREV